MIEAVEATVYGAGAWAFRKDTPSAASASRCGVVSRS